MNTLIEVLINKNKSCKSIWFMRQAGRYLPEFRKIRSQNQDFIKLCLNTDLTTEITLQPLKRFNIDSAIIFSDILIVPYALGQKVNFIKEQGPQLSKFNFDKFSKIGKEEFNKILNPVYEAIKKTRAKLDRSKSLIGFIGAPWTLLVYMMDMKNNKNMNHNLELSYLDEVIKKLNEYLCIHIQNQINSGANVIQVFDSWAGLIPKKYLKKFCYEPNKYISDFCKKRGIPLICFPKGLEENYLNFCNFVKPIAISLDSKIDPIWARNNLKNIVIQGGMDPKFLFKSETEILNEAKRYLDIFKDVPYIFNLGHGLLPETEPEKLDKLIKFIKKFNNERKTS